MYDKFTDRARKVIAFAKEEAQRIGHEYIGTEHVLLGIIRTAAALPRQCLRRCPLTWKS